MRTPRSTLLRAGLAVAVLAVTAASGGNEPGAPPALRLRSAAAFEPESTQDPVLAVLRVAPGAVATLRARLAADGVRVLAYLPDDALLVERAGLDASALAEVVASEPWRAELAITPELASIDGARAKLFPGGVPIVVGLARAVDLAALADRLEGLGARVSWSAPTAAVPQLGLLADPDRLPAVLDALQGDRRPGVGRPAAAACGCSTATRSGVASPGSRGQTPLFDHGLRGQGQVVGIMDTGIDIDHCVFRDTLAGLPALNGAQGRDGRPRPPQGAGGRLLLVAGLAEPRPLRLGRPRPRQPRRGQRRRRCRGRRRPRGRRRHGPGGPAGDPGWWLRGRRLRRPARPRLPGAAARASAAAGLGPGRAAAHELVGRRGELPAPQPLHRAGRRRRPLRLGASRDDGAVRRRQRRAGR